MVLAVCLFLSALLAKYLVNQWSDLLQNRLCKKIPLERSESLYGHQDGCHSQLTEKNTQVAVSQPFLQIFSFIICELLAKSSSTRYLKCFKFLTVC